MKTNNMASRRAFLEQLPTQKLDELLQAELHKENIDDDLVRLLLGVLEERELEYPLEENEVVAVAVEKYITYVDSLKVTPVKHARKWSAVLKVASILLVVGFLFFVVPQVANAENFFEMLARWSESVFEFFNPVNKQDEQLEYVFETDHPGLQQIYDAVVELGVTDPVVPMWAPGGYELEDIRILNQSTDTTVSVGLIKEEDYILLNIILHNEEVPLRYEKDTKNVTILEIGGVQHYVMSNFEEHIVAWVIDGVECSLITNCPEEELYSLLESIYTTED